MRSAIVAAALMAASEQVVAGTFCAVTSMGANCSFPDMQSCQQHLVGIGGQCVVNPQALPQPVEPQQQPQSRQPYDVNSAIDRPNLWRSFQDGRRIGQQQQQRQEEPRSLAQRPLQVREPYRVTYSCPDPEGGSFTSDLPFTGCVVMAVEFCPCE